MVEGCLLFGTCLCAACAISQYHQQHRVCISWVRGKSTKVNHEYSISYIKLTECLNKYLIPLIIAAYDVCRCQRATESWTRPEKSRGALLRIPVALASRVRFFVLQSRLRYLASAALLAISGSMVTSFRNGQQSTYICPIASGEHWKQKTFKVLSLVFDSLIIIGASELSGVKNCREGKWRETLQYWGYGLLVSHLERLLGRTHLIEALSRELFCT